MLFPAVILENIREIRNESDLALPTEREKRAKERKRERVGESVR